MNQKQFFDQGKPKFPLVILKFIWNNLDKIDDLIELLKKLKKDKEPDVVAKGGDDEKEPDPGTTPPAP